MSKQIEIATDTATPTRTITITVHHVVSDGTGDSESWQVSDDGGEFDDASHEINTEAADDVSAREDHYVAADPVVTIRIVVR